MIAHTQTDLNTHWCATDTLQCHRLVPCLPPLFLCVCCGQEGGGVLAAVLSAAADRCGFAADVDSMDRMAGCLSVLKGGHACDGCGSVSPLCVCGPPPTLSLSL